MDFRGHKRRWAAERGRRGGIFEEGQRAPSHQLGGMGSAVSSPAGSGVKPCCQTVYTWTASHGTLVVLIILLVENSLCY